MEDIRNQFQNSVDNYFNYLITEYKFTPSKIEVGYTSIKAIFLSKDLAIFIIFDMREKRMSVIIGKIEDDALPKYNDSQRTLSLINFVGLISPKIDLKDIYEVDNPSENIEKYSHILKKYCADILTCSYWINTVQVDKIINLKGRLGEINTI